MLKIKLSTLRKAISTISPRPNIQKDKDLLAYCLRKKLISFPYRELQRAINYLFNRNELTIEQWETLNACINSGDYSRVLNNKKITKLINIIK